MTQSKPAAEYRAFNALNWHIRFWTFLGLNPIKSQNTFIKSAWFLFSVVLHFLINIYLPLHLVIGLFDLKHPRDIIENLANTSNQIITTAKTYVLWKNLGRIYEIGDISETFERDVKDEKESFRFILDFRKNSKKYTILFIVVYGLCMTLGGFSLFVKIQSHRQFFPGYYPFNIDMSEGVFKAVCIYQYVSWTIQGTANIFFDTYPAILMFLLVQHLRIMNLKISRIGHDLNRTPLENQEILKEATKHHKIIMDLFKTISDAVSSTSFALFLVSSLNIVACIVIISYFSENMFHKCYYLALMICYCMQTAFISYYGSEFEAEIHQTTTSLYFCNWYEQTRIFKKDFLIFMENSLKKYSFSAGYVMPINKNTYLGVLKSTYSIYALLNGFKDKLNN
ncbi:Or59a.2 family protein [Megaselia abdita]